MGALLNCYTDLDLYVQKAVDRTREVKEQISPHADTNQALDKLYGIIDRTKTSQPEAAFAIASGDFNHANLRKVHISSPTCGANTLDYAHTPFRDGYKALPRPPFGKTDHVSVLLLPAYRHKLKPDRAVTRILQAITFSSSLLSLYLHLINTDVTLPHTTITYWLLPVYISIYSYYYRLYLHTSQYVYIYLCYIFYKLFNHHNIYCICISAMSTLQFHSFTFHHYYTPAFHSIILIFHILFYCIIFYMVYILFYSYIILLQKCCAYDNKELEM